MPECPICSGKLTVDEVYDSSSKEIDDLLCHRHLKEQLVMLRTRIMPSKKESSPSVPTLQCPPDCSSKKFCDPSSCALESVREANAIFDRLRRAE